MGVFVVTMLMLLAYGFSLIVHTYNAVNGKTEYQRRIAVASIFVVIVMASGVLYLASH